MSLSLMNKKTEQENQKSEPLGVKSEEKKTKKSWWQRKEKKAEEKVSVSGKVIKKNEKKEEQKTEMNPALLNAISPMNIKFEQNDLYLGENKGSIFGIVSYPVEVDYGWLKEITNIPSSVVGISFHSVSSGDLMRDLNHTINSNIKRERESFNFEESYAAEQLAINASKLYRQINDDHEKVGLISSTIMPFSPEEKELKRIKEKVRSVVSGKNLLIRNMSFFQKEGYRLLSPFYTREKSASEYLDRLVPLSALIGGFPFASGGFNDGTGSYFAKDLAGGLVILDMWKRGEDRTNSNFIILGGSGAGKTTMVKHLITSEFMKGTKIFILDPEGEYRETVSLLGGDIINCGGGKTGIINPLQVLPKPKAMVNIEDKNIFEEIEDETEQIPDLASHLNFLETFFEIYLVDKKAEVIDVLKSSIIELYAQFHITWDSDILSLRNEDFPTMKDLWEYIETKKEKENNQFQKDLLEKLSVALKDMAVGADSFIWNGYTGIEYQSKIVDFDTSGMSKFSKKKKATQYYNVMSYLWQEVVRDRTERVMIIGDEIYLALDKDVPQTANSLRDMMKRMRKYEGSLVLISHLVSEFLSEEIKLYTQPLLDIPTYKILMGTDGQSLLDIKKLYSLNEVEEALLEKRKQGQALAFIGNARIPVQFHIPSYKFDYFGKASGR